MFGSHSWVEGSKSNRALKRLEDHNTSSEREKSVSKARSRKSTNSGPKQTDSSRSIDGGRLDSDNRKECDSSSRTDSDVWRHIHNVPHGRASSKSKKIEDKNSNGGSKTVGSDKHSTSTSRKRDGEEKSQNGRDSVEGGRKRSRSYSLDNTAAQPQTLQVVRMVRMHLVMPMVRLGLLPKKLGLPLHGSDGKLAFLPLHPHQVHNQAQLHLREADLRENVTLHLVCLMVRALPGGQEISLRFVSMSAIK